MVSSMFLEAGLGIFFPPLGNAALKKEETVQGFQTCFSEKCFPFQCLVIQLHLHDATGCGLNCLAGWWFNKIQRCHRIRCTVSEKPSNAPVYKSREASEMLVASHRVLCSAGAEHNTGQISVLEHRTRRGKSHHLLCQKVFVHPSVL